MGWSMADLLDAYHAARRLPSAGEQYPADVNQDRVVDENDIAAIELAFGTITVRHNDNL